MKKQFLQKLGFSIKENSNNIYIKNFQDNYILEVDFDNEKINYGDKIKSGRNTTQNFKDEENWVVLECVNRLLEKGYKPEDIELEKAFPAGHGVTKYLDILVKKDSKSFLMIECKTWGKEFDKELANIYKSEKNQLFTYFQQDRDTDFLVLYTSKISENYDFKKDYKNEIIKIEDSYKETSNAKDFFDRWSKFTKQNGIFEDWVKAYNYKSKALTYDMLEDIKEEDASKIFNRFLEILRHNTVSDKPNAFNKMFTLFLCKIYDELDKKGTNKELEFQWIEGEDDNIKFQKRLSDIYKKGMKEFLDKQVTDFSDSEFREEFGSYIDDEEIKNKLLKKFTEIRLKKSNEFAIKEVNDDDSFEENAKVLKEVVELLQNYKFRYSKKQPFLGDFFELLLTTGLKQEAGQFFTPVPIARFICKSIPIKKIIEKNIKSQTGILPTTIDYAAGSGHFIIEAMEEIQGIINKIDVSDEGFKIKDLVRKYRENPYDWAGKYMYGIEKDYRLVRTSKVGCYLHGDGIATVIHGDGLDSFKYSKVYKGALTKTNPDDEQENAQFDLVLSNPPYSVYAFKGNLKREQAEKDFDLFKYLTDQSSEIEALFIERTKQLLKEDGIAAIILPSSILSNTGIYTKAREIILQNFEIISIVELGKNTFMATTITTVILFLKKRNKFFPKKLKLSVEKFFKEFNDVVFSGTQIEKPVSKYIQEVWENISFEDYISLLKKSPNEKVKNHDIYKEYQNKNIDLDKILEIEKEKIFYFVVAYPQKVVLVKSNKGLGKTKEEKRIETKEEKEFLGYEFSTRKGSEGIHPIQKGKLIDECTKLFDPDSYSNPEKVNHYIYEAFLGNTNIEISEELKENIFKVNLSDLLTLDRANFEKTISTNIKKKIRIESKYKQEKIGNLIIENGKSEIKVGEAKDIENGKYKFFTSGESIYTFNDYLVEGENIYLSTGGNAIVKYFNGKASYSTDTYSIRGNENILTKYLYINLENIISDINDFYFKGQGLKHLQKNDFKEIKIPLPPKEIQQKIVDEIGKLEKIEEKNLEKIGKLEEEIKNLYENSIDEEAKNYRLSDENIFEIGIGKRLLKNEILSKGKIPVYSANVFEPFGYINDYLITDFSKSSILWGIDGDWMVNLIEKNKEFYPTDHCGYLRIINGNLEEKFVKYFLEKEGKKYGFSRAKRASIDRIKNIKISLPPTEKQKEIVGKIEILEKEIENLKQENQNIPKKKKEILKKHL